MNSRHPTPVDHPDTALPRIEEVRKERDERQLIWESCICVYCNLCFHYYYATDLYSGNPDTNNDQLSSSFQ